MSISSIAEFKEIHRVGTPFLKTEWYSKFAFERRPGVFTMRDPKQHAARRKLFARPFSKFELRRVWEPVVLEKVRLAVSQIREELMRDGSSDIMKWWTFLATDVSGHLMFGESFNILQLGKVRMRSHQLRRTEFADRHGSRKTSISACWSPP